ncbi:hypothetical protein [Chitinophaga sp. GbtcB8]|uniref:hypothetical protein n=1 Tax=Chitinophaga sp. GbtcB8 TaxID=2824753 RepID=UPI001C2F8163|nr:hypothetical protein [Chitinophaga sp. GbtcB8]
MSVTKQSITVKNALLIILMMMMGLYLALSAIFSLSYIKDSPADKAAVIKRFDSTYRYPVTRFATISESLPTMVSMKGIISTVGSLQSFKGNEGVLKANIRVHTRLEAVLDEAADTLNRHIENLVLESDLIYKQYQDFLTQLENLYESGNNRFQSATARLSSGLLTKYSEDLITLIGDYQTDAATILHHNISDFSRKFSTLDRITQNSLQSLDVIHGKLVMNDTSLANLQLSAILNTNFLPQNTPFMEMPDSLQAGYRTLPKSGEVGQDWGIVFTVLINPIAQSKNVDVLLVCGMLGFGLLGAAIAIFITGTNLATDSVGSNLLQVTVRGFSAAIVVYLAVRGGIALVASSNTDPSPLVLFLFCFIGAVFSERIWAWAKVQISASFADQPPADNKDKDASQKSKAKVGQEIIL